MYYAIRTSLGENIFTNWNECVKFRDLAPQNAKYKKFAKLEDAKAYLSSPQSAVKGAGKKESVPDRRNEASCNPTGAATKPAAGLMPNYNWTCPQVVAYTDGSFNEAAECWGYGVVMQDQNGCELAIYSGNGTEFASSRNVTGEIHGAVRAIQAAIQHGCESIVIKHDYEGVGAWANGKWKTNLPLTLWYKNTITDLRNQIKVTFERVPGHSGVSGNERADDLAKKACFGIDLNF